MSGTVSTTTDPQVIGQLERGIALVRELTIDPDTTTVNVDHHVWDGHHSVAVSLFPATVEARRRVMASPVFTAAAWEFDMGSTARWSSTDVRGVRVTVHAARSVAVAA